MKKYSDYVRNHFFVDGFFEKEATGRYHLEETEIKGRTSFFFELSGRDSMVIRNVDKKETQFPFFREEKVMSLKKRVDHIIFEQDEKEAWTVHLIEMKSSISTKEKWLEIKGKFRASYLLVLALGAILQLDIQEIKMYTTYEKVTLTVMPENPVSRRSLVGSKPENLMEEWNGDGFFLRFGENCRLPFRHIPVKLIKNEEGVLEGTYSCEEKEFPGM